MAEILLVRHAQSEANLRNFAVFGNKESPLTSHGIDQSLLLSGEFEMEHEITPVAYIEPVLASDFTRTQQTAENAGFRNIHAHPILDESNVDREIGDGVDVIAKHQQERWAPEESRQRARRLIGAIRKGEIGYKIFFTHGMYIASVMLELEAEGAPVQYNFDNAKRGYVPLQATITKVEI